MSFIDKLKKDRILLNNFNKDVVKIITDQVIKNIEYVNNSGITYINYNIPCFLVGYPVYDHKEITRQKMVLVMGVGFYHRLLPGICWRTFSRGYIRWRRVRLYYRNANVQGCKSRKSKIKN